MVSSTTNVKIDCSDPKENIKFLDSVVFKCYDILTNENTMSLSKSGTENLSKDEWHELLALKEAITYQPHTVSPEKMEKFTELMVRSLSGKGDTIR
jgi:hypothetical protein